jgi:hypothetical protein
MTSRDTSIDCKTRKVETRLAAPLPQRRSPIQIISTDGRRLKARVHTEGKPWKRHCLSRAYDVRPVHRLVRRLEPAPTQKEVHRSNSVFSEISHAVEVPEIIAEGQMLSRAAQQLPLKPPMEPHVLSEQERLNQERIPTEEEQVAELYRLGILYEENDTSSARWAGFSLGELGPCDSYSVKQVARYHGRGGRVTWRLDDGLDGDIFLVTKGAWEELSAVGGFDLGAFEMVDLEDAELASLADSWQYLDMQKDDDGP